MQNKDLKRDLDSSNKEINDATMIKDISAITVNYEAKHTINHSTDADTINMTGLQYSSFLANHSINKSTLGYNQNHRLSMFIPESSQVQNKVNLQINNSKDYVIKGK